MTEFLDNETILFKHQAISSKVEGQLVITNLQLLFQANDQNKTFSFPWASILNVEYSPSNDYRTALRLKTSTENEKPYLIQLQGSDKEQRLSEFLRLKSIISDIRKGSTKPTASNSTASAPVSKASPEIDSKLEALKKSLLDSDIQLAQQYKELVQGKIISAEDFWSSHQDLLQSLQVEQFHKLNNRKGTKNFVISDWIHRDEQGQFNIDLTVEMKEMIFLRYPVVRRAFEAEVPLISEVEFWERFFKAEAFHQNRNIEEEKFFAHYSTSAGAPTPSNITPSPLEKIRDLVNLSKGKQRIKIPVNQQIDLTLSHGDYHRKDEVEHVDFDLKKDIAQQSESLARRFNDDSTVVLAKVGVDAVVGAKAIQEQESKKSEDFNELKKPSTPPYKEMNLSKLRDFIMEVPEEGKVASIEPVLGKRLLPSETKPLSQYIPEKAHTERFFRTEINRLTKLENLRTHNSGNRENVEEVTLSLLPPELKQDLQERFQEITELLRHFYFLLNRMSSLESQAPAVVLPFQTKAKAIIDKLLNEKLPSLDSQKKRVNELKKSYDEFVYEAIMATMNGISQLIQRARMTWDATQGSN